MTRRRKIILAVLAVAVVGAGGFIALGRAAGTNGTGGPAAAGRGDARPVVRTVHPRLDPTFRISNQQIAAVEPFYQAGLRARAAGLVRSVSREIGEPVREGDLLVEIDAPDLEQDLEQKEAVIRQREQEGRVSQAMLGHAEAAVRTADAAVAQKRAEAKQAAAARDYKQKLFHRLQVLLQEQVIQPKVVEETEQDYLSAESAAEAARVAVEKAKADRAEKEASLTVARADTELKSALIAVARKDRDKAAAAAGFARIAAPFDGVVVRRNVDPGVFVQNATTGTSEPLITVARVDLVTVAMKLPDVAAPFISLDTDVEVRFDDLPGLAVRGKVTRFAPAIDGSDRTMRVEVDIFNGTRSDFQMFLANTYAEAVAPLSPGCGLGTAAAVLAAERHRALFHKGVSDGTAVCLDVPTGVGIRPLVPGMAATMKVYLDRVAAAHLLPASAVYTQGGKSYLLVVRDGATRQVPVRVQVNDGRMVKVALLESAGDGKAVVHELTTAEEVVVSRQLEVGPGVKVRTVAGDW